ncbi:MULTISPECIES: hypothetical protein [unclassified Moorena]|uniref:hypothetical protein n=1 Tax=unclassified Moorena TaxID=2683338 RepID=UPI0013C1B40B|nr:MULTISPECIES: hypothetical protein [unclassified Moorena]NEO08748.1 hypothetical protein [Moorena sp. SIO3I8]NEP23062.1 hypothetical protein [Moorena sp. SIO3I6]
MFRSCTEERLEDARYFFSSECGSPVTLIATGSALLAEDCFISHYRDWCWHGIYRFSPSLLRKFAPTDWEYAIALSKFKLAGVRVKYHKLASRTTAKIRALTDKVASTLRLEDNLDEFDGEV